MRVQFNLSGKIENQVRVLSLAAQLIKPFQKPIKVFLQVFDGKQKTSIWPQAHVFHHIVQGDQLVNAQIALVCEVVVCRINVHHYYIASYAGQ